VVVVGLLGDLLCASASAQEKVQLRANTPAGTSWTFNQLEEMSLDTTVKIAGQQQQMQQKVSRKISGSAEVLEADATGKPTAIKLVFDPDCGGQMSQLGQQMPIPFSLAGKTVTARMTNGQFSHDAGGEIDDETLAELKGKLTEDDAFLPTQLVGVGDRWTADPKLLAERWQIDPATSQIGVGLTLKELKDVGGRKTAVVELTGEVAGQMEGLTGQRTLSGTTAIDVQTGRVVSGELGGNLTLSGTQQQQVPDGNMMVMDLKSTGTMKVKVQNALKPRGGGMAPIMPAPAVVAPPGGAPPPAPPAPAAALAGTYSSDKLVLKFTPAGVAIAFGGQTYNGTVSRFDGQNFAGKFRTPDGGEFDFNGSVNGPDMTFNTGGTQYQLKGEAPRRNPLAP
jgi:hypothetical protein